MASRVVYRFQQGQRGWTEVFYSGSDPAQAVTEAVASPFLTWRVSCLNQSCVIQSVTAQLIGGNRVSATQTLNRQGGRDRQFIEDYPGYTEVCAFYRFSSALHGRGYWMRGLTENDTDLNALSGDWDIRADIRPRFEELANKVVGFYQTYGYQSLGTAPWQAATAAAPSPDGYVDVSYPATSTPPAAGTRIYFRSLTSFQKQFLGGELLVLAVDPVTRKITLQSTWPSGLTAQTLIQPAAYRSALRVLSPITSGSLVRVSDHDTGRPTNQPRGRARGSRNRRSIPVAE